MSCKEVIERSGILIPTQRDACPQLSLRLSVQRRRHDKHLRLELVRNPHTHPAANCRRFGEQPFGTTTTKRPGQSSKLNKVLAVSPRTPPLRVHSSSSVALRKARAQRKAMCCGMLHVARWVHFGKNRSVLVDWCAALIWSQCGLRVFTHAGAVAIVLNDGSGFTSIAAAHPTRSATSCRCVRKCTDT